ncbi:YoaK family protein [Glycomyces buryatensis]|uniref:DUF1275 domain-containing protein n=1 Tax=Glycomyces buryatensis TaxID=2570927 RepID=A0A4S8QP75_9ACTN|nr:YoaK family protein [Glycomyces buryatensis]THV42514.1 DUF1275 domain-containing protein [Glycomyces buryatensis]
MRHREVLAVLLAFGAGASDALSYLHLSGVLIANQTGNIVLLGVAIAQGRLGDAFAGAVSLLAFFAGMAVGFVLTDHLSKRRFRVLLVLELALLLSLAVMMSVGIPRYISIAVAAFAMGLQAVNGVRLGFDAVSTTYLTGSMTAMVRQLTRHRRLNHHGKVAAVVVAVFFIGVLAVAAGNLWIGSGSLWLPAAAVAAALVFDELRWRSGIRFA